MILLAIRNDRFRLAELVEHDDELAALDLLDLAGEQIADARRELVADACVRSPSRTRWMMRCFAACDGRAAELGEVDRLFEHVADLEPFVVDLRVLDARSRGSGPSTSATTVFRSTMILIVALALVDLDFGLHGRTVLLGEGGEDAVLQQPVQLGAIELLRVRELADRAQNVYGTDHPGLPSLTM